MVESQIEEKKQGQEIDSDPFGLLPKPKQPSNDKGKRSGSVKPSKTVVAK